MKTEVTMKRELFGDDISQKSKSSFFSATDLVRAGNKWRMLNELSPFKYSEWLRNKKTKEFIAELESQFGTVKTVARGRGKHTWVHPFLFIDLALAINPKLKIEVYSWLYDHLLKYRNDSGDSYNKMSGALYNNCKNKASFQRSMILTARIIKNAIGVKDWQHATQDELKLRDKVQENIALLCDVLRDNNQAIMLGINKTIGKQTIIFAEKTFGRGTSR